jgi:hypothetical protein
MSVPAEFATSPMLTELWDALALGKQAREENERLRADNERLRSLCDQYRERAIAAESEQIDRLSKLGYIVIREGEDITNFVNEPGFISWVRWAMTDGWAEMTAATQQLGWGPPTPNTGAPVIVEALGPIRDELKLG